MTASNGRPYQHYTATRLRTEREAAQRKLDALTAETQARETDAMMREPHGNAAVPAHVTPTVREWLSHEPVPEILTDRELRRAGIREIEPVNPTKVFQDGIIRGCAAQVAERAAKAIEAPKPAPLTDGFYTRESAEGTQIYKVQWNQAGTNLYAKILEVGKSDEDYHASWVYAPGAVRQLDANMKLTEAQAAEFGKLYGICCICAVRLTNEESIERGIGPICGDRQGW